MTKRKERKFAPTVQQDCKYPTIWRKKLQITRLDISVPLRNKTP